MELTRCQCSALVTLSLLVFWYYVGVFIYLGTVSLEDYDMIAMLLLWIYPFLGFVMVLAAYAMGMALWGIFKCLAARNSNQHILI